MIRRGTLEASLALAAALAVVTPTWAAKAAREVSPPTLQETAEAYENDRQMARMAGLDQASQSVEQVLRGKLEDDRRQATRFLAGMIQMGKGEYVQAQKSLEEAGDGKGMFADDASFAATEALEAQGNDVETMK